MCCSERRSGGQACSVGVCICEEEVLSDGNMDHLGVSETGWGPLCLCTVF